MNEQWHQKEITWREQLIESKANELLCANEMQLRQKAIENEVTQRWQNMFLEQNKEATKVSIHAMDKLSTMHHDSCTSWASSNQVNDLKAREIEQKERERVRDISTKQDFKEQLEGTQTFALNIIKSLQKKES